MRHFRENVRIRSFIFQQNCRLGNVCHAILDLVHEGPAKKSDIRKTDAVQISEV